MNKDINIGRGWLKIMYWYAIVGAGGFGWLWLLCLKIFVPCLDGPLKIRSYMVLPGVF